MRLPPSSPRAGTGEALTGRLHRKVNVFLASVSSRYDLTIQSLWPLFERRWCQDLNPRNSASFHNRFYQVHASNYSDSGCAPLPLNCALCLAISNAIIASTETNTLLYAFIKVDLGHKSRFYIPLFGNNDLVGYIFDWSYQMRSIKSIYEYSIFSESIMTSRPFVVAEF
jgi:hypothetical protein